MTAERTPWRTAVASLELARAKDNPPCAICGHPAVGYATVNGERLCHGMARDCYRLATVYGGWSHDAFLRAIERHEQGGTQ